MHSWAACLTSIFGATCIAVFEICVWLKWTHHSKPFHWFSVLSLQTSAGSISLWVLSKLPASVVSKDCKARKTHQFFLNHKILDESFLYFLHHYWHVFRGNTGEATLLHGARARAFIVTHDLQRQNTILYFLHCHFKAYGPAFAILLCPKWQIAFSRQCQSSKLQWGLLKNEGTD